MPIFLKKLIAAVMTAVVLLPSGLAGAAVAGAQIKEKPHRAADIFVQATQVMADARPQLEDTGSAAGGVRPFAVPWQVYDQSQLENAINRAGYEDIIVLMQNIDLSASLIIPAGKMITLTGKTLTGANGKDGIIVEGNLTLADITVTHKAQQTGRGVLVKSEAGLSIKDGTVITGNMANYGGGVYVEANATLSVSGGEITANKFTNYNNDGGGVFVAAQGILTMSGGQIAGNAAYRGGGIYLAGIFTMSGGEISGNVATTEHYGNGGGLYVADGGAVAMSGGEISGNKVSGLYVSGAGAYFANNTGFTMTGGRIMNNLIDGRSGGSSYGAGVFMIGAHSTFAMQGGEISGNTANGYGMGGGVYVANGTFAMKDGKISRNIVNGTSRGNGAGVFVTSGTFTMEGGEISYNTANSEGINSGSYGGGVSVNGTFKMTGGEISYNKAVNANNSAVGGGVSVSTGTSFLMIAGTIAGNTADSGGGVHLLDTGSFTMEGGEISGNTARVAGGGVRTTQTNQFTMTGGTISENIAVNGGGIYHGSTETFFMTGGVVSGNTAVSGGGIYIGAGPVSINNGTLSGNQADRGGGIYFYNTYNGAIVLNNSRIVNNTATGTSSSDGGGGIWILRSYLAKLDIDADTIFSGNRARAIYTRNSADDAIYYAHVFCVRWTAPLQQGYNNYDIYYTNGTLKYVVIYDGNEQTEGEPPIDTALYALGDEVAVLDAESLNKTYHVFLGWAADREAIEPEYMVGDRFNIIADTILYAVWEKGIVLSYDGNGYTDGELPIDTTTYALGDEVTVLGAGSMSKADHEFLGWATDREAAEPEYVAGDKFHVTTDTILYAVWHMEIVLSTGLIQILYYNNDIQSERIGEVCVPAVVGDNLLDSIADYFMIRFENNDWLNQYRDRERFNEGILHESTPIENADVVTIGGDMTIIVLYLPKAVNTGDAMALWPFVTLVVAVMLAVGANLIRKRGKRDKFFGAAGKSQ